MINYSNIPDELKELTRWVCVNHDNKVPMRAWENKVASSVNPETWSSFDTAIKSVEHGYYSYCGFVFADDGYVGIDIDDGYDEYGLINVLSADIIGICHSYTEKSRSGRGFHILLKGNLPFKGKNNLSGVEIYKTARYFIMTGDVILYREIIENQEAIDYVVEKYFSESLKGSENVFINRDKVYSPKWIKVVENGKIRLRPEYPDIPNGCRNISLTSLAGTLHALGYSKGHIYDEIMFVNNVACHPQLSQNELQTICNSITRYKR